MKTESPGVAQAILAVWGSATVKRSISSSLQPIRAVSNLDFDNALRGMPWVQVSGKAKNSGKQLWVNFITDRLLSLPQTFLAL